MRQRTAALAGVIAVAAVSTAAAAVMTGVLSEAATTGLRATLERQPASSLSLRTTLPLDDDAAAQDDAARAALTDALASGDIPLDIVGSVESIATIVYPAGPERTMVASVADLPDAATLVEGEWGRSAASATMQADAAASAGLAAGDRLTIGTAEVTVVGTWRVDDPQSARWGGEPIWARGTNGSDIGPLIVDADLWERLDVDARANWIVVPPISRLVPADLDAIATGWEEVPQAFEDAGLSSPTRAGRFLRAADDLAVRLHALSGIGPAAGAAVAAIAALALWALMGLLADQRAVETDLLRTRGATTRRLRATAGLEAGGVALAGAAAGGAAGASAVGVVLGAEAAAAAAAAAAWTTAGIVIATALLAVVRSAPSRASVPSRRARWSAGIAAIVLLVTAAAVSTWQLLTYGALPPRGIDDVGVDPVVVAAPALLLAAIVVVGVVVFPPLATIRAARIARGPEPAVASLTVARRVATGAVPIVLVGIAVGQLAMAAGYAATWRTSFDQTAQLTAGASLRITATSLSTDDLAQARQAPAVTAIAPIIIDEVALGGQSAAVVGASPTAFAELSGTVGGLIDPAAVGDMIAAGAALPALPAGATSITIDITPVPTGMSVWLTDEWGIMRRVEGAVDAGTGQATATFPGGDWRLAAVDVAVAPPPDENSRTLRLDAISTEAGTVSVDGVQWTGVFVLNGFAQRASSDPTPIMPLPFDVLAARLIPAPATSPIVVSRALATALRVDAGDFVSLLVGANAVSVSARIAGVIDAVPGAGRSVALLVDAAALRAVELGDDTVPARPGVAWVGTDDVPAAAASLRSQLLSDIAVLAPSLDPDLTMLAAAPRAMWVAAVGCLVLAVAGLVAAMAAQLRARRDETALLHAIGMSAREQLRSRRSELALVAGWGTIIGVVAGAVGVAVVIATLARGAVPGADPAVVTPVRFDVVAFGVGFVLFAATVAVVVALYGRAVARLALRSAPPGGERAP